eukprot:TRINITY_DN25346_c0_g1_i1.p1 TRINITY_DN25346_c0_g1~~TRINITY_DN25346_c0_g1_i1.p1  ORF type:complete len:1115 (-),score=198.75 TRINITY_DN25346_c0_g1_i1:192-3035(-)
MPTGAAGPANTARNKNKLGQAARLLTKQLKSGFDSCSDKGIAIELEQGVRVSLQAGSAKEMHFKGALGNYCILRDLVKRDSDEVKRGANIQDLVSGGGLQPAGRPRTSDELQMFGPDSVEHKRQQRSLLATRHVRWVDSSRTPSIASARQLYLQAMIISQKVSALVELVRQSREYDWMEVKENTQGIINRAASHAARWTAAYLAKIAANLKDFFKNLWQGFCRRLENAERQCKERNARIQDESSSGLMKPADRSNEKSVNSFIQSVSGLNTKRKVNDEAANLEAAMDRTAASADEGVTLDQMQRDVDAVKREQMEVQTMVTATGQQSGDPPEKTLEKMDETNRKVENVERGWCGNTIKKSMSGFKETFSKIKNAIIEGGRAAIETPFPLLGIRGVGGAAGIAAAGFEEVVDLRNMEIAEFKWGSGFFGTSSTGAGIGAYAGLGWKGYKENWTLEEGYQTGLWVAQGVNLNFMGLPVGFGVTFGTDADNSRKGEPWIPEPHGINAVLFGWSASASLSNLVVPLTVDAGASYYWMINSECYDNIQEFLKYIWLPSCRLNQEGKGGCYPGAERAKITALRTGLHIATPVLPDLAFTLLASLYNMVRDTEYKPRCSDRSTNLRDNVTHFSVQVGKLLFESVQSIHALDTEMELMASYMSIAHKYNDHDIEKSSEYADWKGKIAGSIGACPKSPADLLDRETLQHNLQDQPVLWQKEFCTELGLGEQCIRDKPNQRAIRISTALGLQVGDVGITEIEQLISKINEIDPHASDLTSTLLEVKQNCVRPDSCTSGSQIWKMLKPLGKQPLRTLCDAFTANCKQKHNAVVSKYHDEEMLAMKIVGSLGGGTTDVASSSNPFGTCKEQSDCPLANTECPVQAADAQRGTVSQCQCKARYCHDVDLQTHQDICRAETDSYSALLRQIRSKYDRYKVEVGMLMGKLSQLAPHSSSPGR